ncbi:unnamed protein product [Parnassius mnemosyne]|uniref:DUF7869 domain-containing protein n=1 Tax=Parnassius mnemosyne TaxID=213953 RepID=A0AAV1LFC1_9NEOP
MERKGRKRDILEMALKTSGIRNQKKCRKSLLSEFNKKSAILTSSAPPPNAVCAILTNPTPDPAPAILISSTPDAATAILTSSAPNAAPAIFTSPTIDAASAILTSFTNDAASAVLTSPATEAASATLTGSALNAVSAVLTSPTTDAASAILTSSAPDAASAVLMSSASDAASTVLTSPATDAASAIFTRSVPDATSAACWNSTPPGTETNLSGISLRDIPSTSFVTELNNNVSPTMELSNEISSIPNSAPNFVRSYVSQQPLDVLPGTSLRTGANNNKSSSFRITRPAKKQSYLDYMSDDEIALLNSFGDAGSSDEWEPERNEKKRKQMTINVEEEFVGNKATKKVPKNKRKQAAQKRLSGQSYIKTNGEVVQEKKVQPNPCVGKKCGNNCGDITEERRISIFKHFWSLSEQRRKDWIISLTQKTNIKRKRNKDSEKRTITYKYNITDGEAHRQICLQFLCKTIDVSHKYIYYTVSTADEFGSAKQSERGKSVPPNKTSNDEITAVENYIKCLPAVPSHYCRKDSTRTYLPAEYKNLANLYRKYKEYRSFQGLTYVSESIFRKVFNENFNIAFHIPKKDKCLKCCQYENKTNPTPEQRRAHEEHLIEKDHTYNRYKMHKTIHLKDSASICISFDLQKVLNTPYGDSMLLFYTRKLAVYNAVIYENGTRNVYCYYWDESQGNRGANEMATILSKYITKLDERGNIRQLLLYCDCCRNKIVLAMLNEILQRCRTLESIQINFLLTGHTYMTVDSVHAIIENHVKNTTIWAPSQWYTVFQTARQNPKPFHVEQLTHKDFKRWDLLADKYFVGNLVGKISKIRVATFKKNRISATVKYSMNPETPVSCIEIASKTKFLDLPDCYLTPLPITENKHKDLLKLCSDQVIPQQFQAEYLAFNKTVKDTLPDTDIEDNVDQ